MLALLFTKKKRPKQGLKSVYHAQTIVSVLDESVDRNLDYLLAVNTLTGYLLLLSEKPREACEFLVLAEKVAFQLNEVSLKEKSMTSTQDGRLEPIAEQQQDGTTVHGNERKISMGFKDLELDSPKLNGNFIIAFSKEVTAKARKKEQKEDAESRISANLLSNLTLSIVTLKNIAAKFAYPELFESQFASCIKKVTDNERNLVQVELTGLDFGESKSSGL